eukprot:CAMPEP_0184656154 /NCGR_PEP_ID=MMETSP0308-20130426/15808_1 /TAXON_ID=38269 /ORGANISM="Gloeochaete witrockiana, Strain SAG 46.84" /LENGTH=73 /DNA_ID=CAMNT_0027093129 /DNA_START=144 /DNA_END=365 /DNA_ORIENTATION=-
MDSYKVRLGIEGMGCNGCRTKIEKKLSEYPGVVSAAVSLQSKSAEVEVRGVTGEQLASFVQGIDPKYKATISH